MELLINNLFRDVLPSLTNEEYNGLKEDLLQNGCIDSIKVWNNTIIDGHNRCAICNENNIEFKTEELNFNNDNEAIAWIVKNQTRGPGRNWDNHLEDRNKLIASMFQKRMGKSAGKGKVSARLEIGNIFNLSQESIKKILLKGKRKNRNASQVKKQKVGNGLPVSQPKQEPSIAKNNTNPFADSDILTEESAIKFLTNLNYIIIKESEFETIKSGIIAEHISKKANTKLPLQMKDWILKPEQAIQVVKAGLDTMPDKFTIEDIIIQLAPFKHLTKDEIENTLSICDVVFNNNTYTKI